MEQYAPSEPQAAAGGELARALPAATEAEAAVLGCMMVNPQTILDIVEIVREDDFYKPAHQLIYAVIIELANSERGEVDPLIVSDRLEKKGQLGAVGGPSYLHTLVSSVMSAANARYYAEIVAEKGVLRRLIGAGEKVVQLAYDAGEDEIEAVIDQAQQEVFAVSQRNSAEDYVKLDEALRLTVDEIDQLAQSNGELGNVPTGFIDLDEVTTGLRGGQMIIIAARPGVGKSTLAMDIMREASLHHGLASVIFSLEMSRSEIIMRLLSAESGVRLSALRSGSISDDDMVKIVNTIGEISDCPLFIDDSSNLTIMDIRAKARKLKQKADLQLIVVDYMQLMTSGKRVESRQQEVSEFSRQLKLLAKELDVPLIAISQLNRGPESRTDKRPQLADLRESGSLEQDADIVMLLYRPDSQDPDNERAGEADIILAKHRGGPITTVTVASQLHLSRFHNLGRMTEGA